MTAFFDTSALIALSNPKEIHHGWSMNEFTVWQSQGPIIISEIVYAELCAGMATKNDVDRVITDFGLERGIMNEDALYLAGIRFKAYKGTAGNKTNVLPDFFIGAFARTLNVPLVTANKKDFKSFFHGLVVVHPSGQFTIP